MTSYRPAPLFASAVAAVALLFVWGPVAQAQTPPVKYVVGNDGLGGFLDTGGIRLRTATDRGIRAGKFIIWPSLVLEARYDSNFYQDALDSNELVNSTPLLRILPAFAITNPRPSKVAFSLGAAADARVYMSGDQVLDDHSNVGAKGDLRVDILPNGPITITFVDTFRRDIDAALEEIGKTFNRNHNRGGVKLSFHPGGGALDVALGYLFSYLAFDDFTDGNYLSHDMQLRTSWRFYPKTVAFFEATGALRNWASEPKYTGLYVDSNNLRVYLGLTGFITKRLGTLVKIGYGNSFHSEGESFENVIAQAEVQYKFTSRTLAAVGFLRDYRNSFFGNYFAENRTYLRGQFQVWKMGLDLSVAYYLNDYSKFDPAEADPTGEGRFMFVSHKERRDQLLSAHVKLNFDITRWIGVTLGYEFKANFTNFVLTQYVDHDNNAATPRLERQDPGRFTRHQIYGSVNVRY